MKLQVGYGAGVQEFDVPDKNLMGVMRPNPAPPGLTGAAEAERALRSPIGTPPLREIARPGETVAIITSDNTRPFPGHTVLPLVLRELEQAGVRPSDITVVVALGIHRPLTDGEIRALVGADVYSRVRCVNSAPGDYVRMGATRRGTPVDVTCAVAAADRRVALGNVEYHYFAGYSGGAKAIMPGVSTRAAIQNNHGMMACDGAAAGRLDGNPVREDIDDVLNFCPLDFIVNVVLDESKNIIYAAAGHPIDAHRSGCRYLDGVYAKRIARKADVVIASQGGKPKDVNLYQTQKALDNAKYAVRDGGVIILAGSCGEGMGEAVFEEWMTSAPSPQSIIRRIEGDFQLGGHKAAAIAATLQKAEIFLVSDMAPDFVESIFLKPYATVRAALDAALRKAGPDASVLVMPFAGSTLPIVDSK